MGSSSIILQMFYSNYILSEHASSYNSKFSKTLQQFVEEIQARKDWIGVDWVDEDANTESATQSTKPEKSVRLLDYACGTGLVTRVCPPYTPFTSSLIY
jgi:hypothetical protein